MLYWICVFLCSALLVQGERNNDCSPLETAYLIKASQVDIISKMQADLPCKQAYKEGETEFEKVFESCYQGEDSKREHKEAEEIRFGSEDTYCLYGGLRTIRDVINITEAATAKYNITMKSVTDCEDPFYNEFRRNVSSSKLCVLYKETHDCQNSLLSATGTTLVEENFEDPGTTSELIPYCPNIKTILDVERQKILKGESHATSSDVIIPVAVICSVLGAAIIATICWMARKERSKKKTAGYNSNQQQVSSNTDPQNGTAEAIPLATVTRENEGISTA